MGRPTAEDRRRDYLELGARIVTEFDAARSASAPVDALADVKVADVAARAGVTKGAVYHIWPSQAAYRHDLLARLLEQNRQRGVREVLRLLEDDGVAGDDPTNLLRRYADFVFDAMKDDPGFYARFCFFVYASNPEVADLLASGDDALVEDFGPYLELYLQLVGRRLREPFTVRMLLLSINALFQGLCLRYRTSPDLVERRRLGAPTGSSLYAAGIDALVQHFSEPDPDRSGAPTG
jgi:AcrR family transcriptional regulator